MAVRKLLFTCKQHYKHQYILYNLKCTIPNLELGTFDLGVKNATEAILTDLQK